MKRNAISLSLVLALLLSLFPTAAAVSAAPDGFLQPVTLALPEARTSGLMDEPETPLPSLPGSSLMPELPAQGALPGEVGEADPAATPISSPEELAAMQAGGNYVLTGDIDLSGITWSPRVLRGSLTLDGQGHAISGGSSSLLASITGQLTVKNLVLSSFHLSAESISMNTPLSVTGGSAVGGALATVVNGALTVENCSVEDLVIQRGSGSAEAILGGLVSYAQSCTVSQLALQGTVDMDGGEDSPKADALGMVIGRVRSDSTLTGCLVRGDLRAEGLSVSSFYGVGGLVGHGQNAVTFRDCHYQGELSVTCSASLAVGGLLGYGNGAATFDGCTAAAQLSGQVVGGLAGYISDSSPAVFTDCRFSGSIRQASVSSGSYHAAGGLAAYLDDATFAASGCSVRLQLSTSFSAFNSATRYLGGLAGYSVEPSRAEGCVVSLEGTVAQGAEETVVIGGLVAQAGNFAAQDCLGSLTLRAEGGFSTGRHQMGGLVGGGEGNTVSLTNCGCTLDVKLDEAPITAPDNYSAFGGLVGQAGGARLRRCWSNGEISLPGEAPGSEEYYNPLAGGLVGLAQSELSAVQCYSGCELSGITYALGGLAGSVGFLKPGDSGKNISASSALLQSCWTDGAYSSETYHASGLLGCFYTEAAAPLTVLDCYTDACLPSGFTGGSAERFGGLVGSALGTRLSMENCYVEFDQAAPAIHFGGLIGCLTGPSLRISFCSASGHMGAPSAQFSYSTTYSGGLVGEIDPLGNALSQIYGCQFTGSVFGTYAGGICGLVYDTTISHCQAQLTSRRYVYRGEATESLGGIAGELYSSAAVDCSVSGLAAVRDTSDDLSSRSSKVLLFLGGITGQASQGTHLERCQVEGGLSLSTRGPNSAELYVGGLVGQSSIDISIKQSQFEGDIRLSALQTADTVSQHSFYVGSLMGHDGSSFSSYTTLEAVSCDSTVSLSADPSFGKLFQENAMVGRHVGGYLEWAPVPSVTLPEGKTENYTIYVQGYTLEDMDPQPLSGVPVTVNGTSVGISDASGIVSFDSKTLQTRGAATVSGSLEGYFDAETWTLLADGGAVNLYLQKKTPGEIYIKSATIDLGEGAASDILSGANTVWIPQLDAQSRAVYVGVDWNDIQAEGRSLRLVDADGEDQVTLSANQNNYLVLPECFDANEKLYVVASGIGEDGKTYQTKRLLSLKVKALQPNLPVPAGEQEIDTSEDGLYFLQGLGIDLNLGDIAGFASKISYKNGVLTLEFSGSDKSKNNISVWTGFSEKVSITGSVKIPITNLYQGEWSGTIKAAINQSVNSSVSNSSVKKYNKDEKNLHKLTYNFLLFGIPCFLETGLSVGGDASLSLYGPYDEVHFKGDISANGSASLFGGVGGSVTDKVELKFGGQGKLEAKLPMTFSTEEGKGFRLDPSISGTLSAKASLKAYILDLSKEIQIGGFTWDKNGARWVDGDIALMSLAPEAWTPMGRTYLAGGGGFLAEDISLFSFSSDAAAQLRYANIFSGSDSVLTTQDGQAVLYFTADDGSGTSGQAAEHTALYRSVRQADGSWSEPAALSTSGAFPASPAADGAFAVWVESADSSSLDSLLSSTSIQVAKDGELLYTIPGGGYVYAPQVSVSADGSSALICWLSDPAVTRENLAGGGATLHYASYQAGTGGAEGTWTTGQVETNGQSVASAVPSCDAGTITYKGEDGSLYQSTKTRSGSFTATPELWISGVGRYATDGTLAAFFQENGTLFIQQGGSIQGTLDTGFSGTENPVLLSDGSASYVLWVQADGVHYTTNRSGSWCQPLLLSGTQQLPTGLSAALTGGLPLVSYLVEEEGQANLYTALPMSQGVDLVLTGLSYDQQALAQEGILTLQADLFNNGLTDAANVELVITDEDGNEVYRVPMADGSSAAAPVASGAEHSFYPVFAPDPSCVHTYTVSVTPLSADGSVIEEADFSDNSLSIQVGVQAASVADASFLLDPQGSCSLQALVRNSGSVTLPQLDLLVYASDATGAPLGDPLAQQRFSDVPAGSYRQLLLEGLALNSSYTVVASTPEGEVLDTALVCYADFNTTSLQVQSLEVSASGEVRLSLAGQNLDLGPSQLLLALYEGDRMVTCGSAQTETLDGTHTFSLALADPVSPGHYDYRLFFLSPGQTYHPQLSHLTGAVTVE